VGIQLARNRWHQVAGLSRSRTKAGRSEQVCHRARIALVFGVGLEHFFRPDAERPLVAVVRKADRIRLPERPGPASPAYFFESLDYPVSDRKLNGYYVEVESEDQPSDPHVHPGAELVFVLQGELVINVAGEDHTLRRGDAIYFDCANPHTYRRNGRSRCAAIVVVTGYESRRSAEVADPAYRSSDERRIAN
jgi:quercetin dioxygenase-like cupin family protein